MKDTLQYIVTAIVEKPDAVIIDETDDDGVVTLVITVDKDDMGRVIGKEGKVIRAIRNVMKIVAVKSNKKVTITLAEQNPPETA